MQQFLQFIILTFIYSSTCFERPHAHLQELNNCSSSLWFYLRSVVVAMLLVVVGPAGPTTTNSTVLVRTSENPCQVQSKPLQAVSYHYGGKITDDSEVQECKIILCTYNTRLLQRELKTACQDPCPSCTSVSNGALHNVVHTTTSGVFLLPCK